MKIALLGDVFARPGRQALRACLPRLRQKHHPDLIVANGENAAGGLGITSKIVRELHHLGIDAITSGNHVWHKREVIPLMDSLPHLLRPLNLPPGTPGRGLITIPMEGGAQVVIINLLGRVFMSNADCPFRSVSAALESLPPTPPESAGRVILVDFHAEATSEKAAMGHHLDGKVALVAGTHTHVQTSDERILDQGTGYITDVGMTGARDSVIGHEKQQAVAQFIASRNLGFSIAQEDLCVEGVLLDADPQTGLARSITRIRIRKNQTPPQSDGDGE